MRWIVPALLTVGLVLSGCGSSSKKDGGDSGGPAGPTVSTMNVVGYGKALSVAGKPVYVLSGDPAGGSKCTGKCASAWPPVTTNGKPAAGSGVDDSLLSTFKRPDGGTQVLYAKHALYKHNGRGLVSGAGAKSDDGTGYLIGPSGKPIKGTKSGGY